MNLQARRPEQPRSTFRWIILAAVSLWLGGLLLVSLQPDPVVTSKPVVSKSRIIQLEDYMVYLPAGWRPAKPRPLVILLSPTGEPGALIQAWQTIADHYQWVLLGSRKFHNGIGWDRETGIYRDMAELIETNGLPCKVDRRRIIASGISGGGWGAHNLAFLHPDLVSGVVINTGMMNKDFLRPQKDHYPKNKFAVFLASPADFRYQEMADDRRFLEGLGWQTKWLEFSGGHVLATPETYRLAASWVVQRWEGTERRPGRLSAK